MIAGVLAIGAAAPEIRVRLAAPGAAATHCRGCLEWCSPLRLGVRTESTADNGYQTIAGLDRYKPTGHRPRWNYQLQQPSGYLHRTEIPGPLAVARIPCRRPGKTTSSPRACELAGNSNAGGGRYVLYLSRPAIVGILIGGGSRSVRRAQREHHQRQPRQCVAAAPRGQRTESRELRADSE